MALRPGSVNPLDAVKPAGKQYMGRDEGVHYCMSVPAPRAPTPERARRFRAVHEPGVRVRHAGYRGDDNYASQVHGSVDRRTPIHSADILEGNRNAAAVALAEKREAALYASVKRAPIGKASAHGSTQLLGAGATATFGAPTDQTNRDAKEVIFPADPDPSSVAAEKIYERTHSAYGPGVQRSHGVVWAAAGIHPSTHVFGVKATASAASADAVHALLHPEVDDSVPRTRIVPKASVDVRMHTHDPLGATRGRAVLDTSSHPAVYGRPTRNKTNAGDWNVADCLRGDFTPEQMLPDADLGRTVGALAVGHAITAPTLPPADRRFGVPSIRTDVPARNGTSIATAVDWGTGPGAAALLSPSPYAEHGIDVGDFTAPRTLRECEEIFTRCGYPMSHTEAEAIFARAADVGVLTPIGSVCIEEFRRVMDEVIEARELGEQVAWWPRE